MLLSVATFFYYLVFVYESVSGESFVIYILRHNETDELVGHVCNVTHLDYPVNGSDYTTEAYTTVYPTNAPDNSSNGNNETTTELTSSCSISFVGEFFTDYNKEATNATTVIADENNVTASTLTSGNSTSVNHTLSWEESVRSCDSVEISQIRNLNFMASSNVTVNCTAVRINETESAEIVDAVSGEFRNLTLVDFHRVYENYDVTNVTFYGARLVAFVRSDSGAVARLNTQSDRRGHRGMRHRIRVHHQVFDLKGGRRLKAFSYTCQPTSRQIAHAVERGFTESGKSWMFTVVYVA